MFQCILKKPKNILVSHMNAMIYLRTDMKFLRGDAHSAARAIARSICDGLYANKKVLWLISGGSNIAVEKEAMDLVLKHAADETGGLAVIPVDERYGPSGHEDSNTAQLKQSGFDPGKAFLVDVLIHNTPFDQTVGFYNSVITAALANADIVIGEFGMGSDGHIAGIKPDSPVTEPDESSVAGYTWEDYTRMTLMPAALKQITKAFLVAYGDDKKAPLKHLQKNDQPFRQLPSVLLYELPKVYVYNDQIGSGGKK
jgi:6-phosphogluconolactonase/glucosamine-6-phosphate isomerase/deaminase